MNYNTNNNSTLKNISTISATCKSILKYLKLDPSGDLSLSISSWNIGLTNHKVKAWPIFLVNSKQSCRLLCNVANSWIATYLSHTSYLASHTTIHFQHHIHDSTFMINAQFVYGSGFHNIKRSEVYNIHR